MSKPEANRKEKSVVLDESDAAYVPLLDSPDVYKRKAEIFTEGLNWVAKLIYRTNKVKGWVSKRRTDGDMIALLHSECSELLEWLRKNPNKASDHVPDITGVEEECADILIRLLDFCYLRKINLSRALFLKMEFNRNRPFLHGGKRF